MIQMLEQTQGKVKYFAAAQREEAIKWIEKL
jgi:hypothetical protein